MTTELDLDDVPLAVADKLARRCWSVSRDDLRQEARAAALAALKNFDPEKGELRGYIWRSVARHLTNYMWEQGSPVSYKHRRNELRNVRRASVEAPSSGVINMPSDEDMPRDVAAVGWSVRVGRRLQVLAELEDEGTDADAHAAVVPCLVADVPPMAVAEHSGLTLRRVMDAISRLSDVVRRDPVMARLWRELECSRASAVRPLGDGYDDNDGGVDDDEQA